MSIASKILLNPTVRLRWDSCGVIVSSLLDAYQVHILDPITATFLVLSSENEDITKICREIANIYNVDMSVIRLRDIISRFKGYFYHVGKYRRRFKLPSVEELLEKPLDNVLLKRYLHLQSLPKLSSPISITYCPTFRCPLKCIYCYASTQQPKEQERTLSLERMKEIILDAAEQGVFALQVSGGEPLLEVEKVLEVIKEASSRGIYTEISTKYPVSESLASEIKNSGIDKVQVSVDSLNPSIQDKLTGVMGSSKWLMDSVINLVSKNIRVQTNTVITSLNIEGIPQLVKTMLELGVSVIALSPYGLSVKRPREDLKPSYSQYKYLLAELYTLFKQYKECEVLEKGTVIIKDENVQGVVNFMSILMQLRILEGDGWNVMHEISCGAYRIGVAILPDGRVVGCDRMASLPFLEYFVVGDLKLQNLKEIFNSPRAKLLSFPPRELYQNTICFYCNEFEACRARGFCYLDAYFISQKPLGPRLFCPHLKG
jgi:radical SAM protein with 4Fe4S-binding SPASM domain